MSVMDGILSNSSTSGIPTRMTTGLEEVRGAWKIHRRHYLKERQALDQRNGERRAFQTGIPSLTKLRKAGRFGKQYINLIWLASGFR